MVLVDSDRIPRVPPYSGAVSCFFTISATGLSPCFAGLPFRSPIMISCSLPTVLQPPILRSVWALPFRSPLLRESFVYFLLQVLIASPRVSPLKLFIHFRIPGLYSRWVPIRTSTDRCMLTANRRISAVCCVLLRLSVPRHPPYALLTFTLFWCLL